MSDEESFDPVDRAGERAQIGLGRGDFARQLAAALVDQGSGLSRGVVIGLTGPWGSGKSTVVGAVASSLEQQSAVVVRFNPWLISGRDDLIAAFFTELAAALSEAKEADLSREFAEKARRAIELVARYGRALIKRGAEQGMNIILPGSGQVAGDIADAILSAGGDAARPLDKTLQARRDELREALASLGKPVVVVIDELDRVEDAEVRTAAQLVKAVADFPAISYLLAYDRDRVLEALGGLEGKERGASYLEKIVQYEVSIPVAFAEELKELAFAGLAELFGRRTVALPPGWEESPLLDELMTLAFERGLLETPRDVKRWIGQYDVLEPMVRDEVHWADVLAFAMLESKHPEVATVLRSIPGGDVGGWIAPHPQGNDPEQACEQLFQRNGWTYSSESPLVLLFQWLFPALRGGSEARWSEAERHHPDRLYRWRANLTLARRGRPPGIAAREQAEDFLEANLEEAWVSVSHPLRSSDYGIAASRFYDVWKSASFDRDRDAACWRGAIALLAAVDKRPLSAVELVYDIIEGHAGGLLDVLLSRFSNEFLSAEVITASLAEQPHLAGSASADFAARAARRLRDLYRIDDTADLQYGELETLIAGLEEHARAVYGSGAIQGAGTTYHLGAERHLESSYPDWMLLDSQSLDVSGVFRSNANNHAFTARMARVLFNRFNRSEAPLLRSGDGSLAFANFGQQWMLDLFRDRDLIAEGLDECDRPLFLESVGIATARYEKAVRKLNKQ